MRWPFPPSRPPPPEKPPPPLFFALTALALAACMVLTWAQTGHWEDNFTLWGHALEAAPSALAHNEMGVALWRQGDRRLAVAHFRAALRLDPRQPQANANLARVLALQGHTGEAAAHWREACRLLPRQYQGDYPPPPPGMERWPGAPAAGTGGP